MSVRRIQIGDFRISLDDRRTIGRILESGRISEGVKVRNFELEWAKFIGTKYAVAVNSGTSALLAGLLALKHYKKGIKKGSKIITTPLTYIATSNAIVAAGFEPVFVDVDSKTFLITPENIRRHLEAAKDIKNYSLILPVHLMGYPCDMDGINRVAREYGLQVFEDAAEAHGTRYKAGKAGAFSLLSAYSFYIAHNIQAGELGAVNTNDYKIAQLVRKIKANGRMCDCFECGRMESGCPKVRPHKLKDDFDPRFSHDLIGLNFKTMEFQAALASSQIKRAERIIKKRQENVAYLNKHLDSCSCVLQLPVYSKEVSYLGYPVLIKRPELIQRRDLRAALEENGIETRPLFGCIPAQQPAYSYLKKRYAGRLPNADYLGRNAFYIGCHQYLKKGDLDYIIRVFEKVIENCLG